MSHDEDIRLAEHELYLAQIRDDITEILEQIHRLSKVLLTGNGEPSICTRMALIERTCADRHRVSEARAGGRYALWAAIGAALLSSASAVVVALL